MLKDYIGENDRRIKRRIIEHKKSDKNSRLLKDFQPKSWNTHGTKILKY